MISQKNYDFIARNDDCSEPSDEGVVIGMRGDEQKVQIQEYDNNRILVTELREKWQRENE